jgi:hypothetical protein
VIGFMPMMIGNPAPSDIPEHIQVKINESRDWKITLRGQDHSMNGQEHPTFANYFSAMVYCQLLEDEFKEIAGG